MKRRRGEGRVVIMDYGFSAKGGRED